MADEKRIKDDYEYSRDTYYDLIEKGRESLDCLLYTSDAADEL